MNKNLNNIIAIIITAGKGRWWFMHLKMH